MTKKVHKDKTDEKESKVKEDTVGDTQNTFPSHLNWFPHKERLFPVLSSPHFQGRPTTHRIRPDPPKGVGGSLGAPSPDQPGAFTAARRGLSAIAVGGDSESLFPRASLALFTTEHLGYLVKAVLVVVSAVGD